MPSSTAYPACVDPHLLESSVRLIASLQDPSGAYPASPTFSAYRGYCWLRDGAFIADAMSAAGEFESAERFFAWCARVITSQRDAIENVVKVRASGGTPDVAHMPPTRFTLAGEIGTDGWWDFQTDGYGTWLWALSEHVRRGGAMRDEWLSAIHLTAEFLIATWDMPCFDWWEEHEDQRHVSTLGCVTVGLERAVAQGWLEEILTGPAQAAALAARELIRTQAMIDGRVTKWIGSTAVDGSLSALVFMGFFDDESVARTTVEDIRRYLVVDAGVHRFTRDVFYGGGLWPLLTCFLGLAEIRLGDAALADDRLAFAASTVNEAGEMPEQVDHHLLAPDHRREWLDRWGPVATPLLWSHAMYVRLAVERSAS